MPGGSSRDEYTEPVPKNTMLGYCSVNEWPSSATLFALLASNCGRTDGSITYAFFDTPEIGSPNVAVFAT